MAVIGVAAVLIVMTASVGPAEALFGVNLPSRQQAAPERLTAMPENVYQRREQLQEFVSCTFGDPPGCPLLILSGSRCALGERLAVGSGDQRFQI